MRQLQIVWEYGNIKLPWRINIAVRWKLCYPILYLEWRITRSSVSWENYYETIFIFITSLKSCMVIKKKKMLLFSCFLSKTGDFAKTLAQMKQTGHHAECVCCLTDSDRFSWYTVLPPNPPLNHLSVMTDKTKFRPTNQSLSSVYLSINYDLCLPVPPSSDSVQPQLSTLPGSVGNTVTHLNTSC